MRSWNSKGGVAVGQSGPKTDEGKAVASRNATSHGIMSEAPVVGRETEEEWLAHRQGLEESLQPEGYLEMCLVERIALLFWRLRRLTVYETEKAAVTVVESERDWILDEDYRKKLLALDFQSFRFAPSKEHRTRKRMTELLVPDGSHRRAAGWPR
jgi:hypothetical protein